MKLRDKIFNYNISENNISNYSNHASDAYQREINQTNSIYIISFYLLFLLSFLMFPFIMLVYLLSDKTTFIVLSFVFIIFLLLTIYSFWGIGKKKQKIYQKYKKFFILKDKIDDFNKTIDKLATLLNSEKAGKIIPYGTKILIILQLIQNDLLSALTIDKFYREDPKNQYDKRLNIDISTDNQLIQSISRNNTQDNEIYELLTKWQEIRDAIKLI